MNSLSVLLVEDDPQIAQDLTTYLESLRCRVVGVGATLTEALGLFYATKPDIVILDIFLGDQPAGISFAKTVAENEATRRPFIFLTEHAEPEIFAQAKLTAPYSYLLKPFNPLELQYAIELALEKFADEVGTFTRSGATSNALLLGNELLVKAGNTLQKLSTADVTYVAVEGKYCEIRTGSGKYLVLQTLKSLMDKFPTPQFVRIHRNYLVNSHAIDKIHLHDQQVILKSGETLPYSQNFKKVLLNNFDILK